MFCTSCGKELQDGWVKCPYCGKEVQASDFRQEENIQSGAFVAESHSSPGQETNGNTQESKQRQQVGTAPVKEYHLEGVRRTGRFSFFYILTKVLAQEDDIEITTEFKKETKRANFKKSEIEKIDFKFCPIWSVSNIIGTALFALLMLISHGLSIFGVIFELYIVYGRHLVLTLSNGTKVSVPIRQDADAIPVLSELGYTKIDIQRLERKRISDSAWRIKEWAITVALLALAASAIAMGLESYSTDHTANAREKEKIELIKQGAPQAYPDITYGEAFENFFSSPTWEYFVGTVEGDDDDGDGEPDYTKKADIVEFTGYCTYKDEKVKALIQFALDDEGENFDTLYLSFNDVPQNNLTLYALITAVFTDEDLDNAVESQSN